MARTEPLQTTHAELESFGYPVSHDLQSPRRSIQGFLFLLERRLKGRLNAEEERLIERVRVNVLRRHELIHDLLALARASQGHWQWAPVDLSRLADHVVAQEQLRSPQRGVEVHTEPQWLVQCDKKLARIELENLIGNAWKYSRKAENARIGLGALARTQDEPLTLYVRHNGAGFDMR